jgi:hypothetical protein
MTAERKRNVIERMVKRITIGKGEIDMSLTQLSSYKEIRFFSYLRVICRLEAAR